MTAILGLETGLQMPSFGGLGAGLGTGITWIIYLVIIAGVLGLISYILYQKKIYSYKIQYYENLGGNRFIEAGSDVARVVRLGLVDGELLWAKKKKMYLPADGLRMGLNKFYFAKNNDDGYWYNITLGDLDAKAGLLDIEPTDRDMKAIAYAVRKNTEGRHAKKNGLKEILPYVIPGILLLILVIGGWYMIKQTKEWSAQVSISTNENMKINGQIAENNKVIITKLEQIMANSGIREAPGG